MRRFSIQAFVILTLCSPLAAQESSPSLFSNPGGSFPNSPPEAPHRHSSTVAEGFLRGEAALVGAAGNYELLLAQAAILRQMESTMAMENKVNKTAYYIKRKQLLAEYHELERLRKLVRRAESQELLRARERERAENYQLSSHQWNSATGAIYWPTLVAGPRYAAHRAELERLLGESVRYGVSDDFREELAQACRKFRDQLRQDFLTDQPAADSSLHAEYAGVERLLKGLRHVPDQPTSPAVDTLSMN
jgi:hypothetical protein